MIKVALIGIGYIGNAHLSALKQIGNAQLTAIVDYHEENGRKAAQENNAKYFKNIDDLLKNADIDCVDICVPTFAHAELAIKAANAGKHILCEKPLALSLNDADDMINAAKQNNVKAMTGHVLRFWPEYVKIKEIIDSRYLGRPLNAFCERLAVTPDWQVGAWDKSEKFSGGAAIDLHIHDLDLLIWLFGKPEIVKANGILTPENPKEGGFSHIFTSAQFRNGEAGFAEGGWSFKGSFPFTMVVRVLCEKGTIEWVFRAGKNIEERSQAANIKIYSNDGSTETIEVKQEDPFFRELSYFFDCIENDRQIRKATFEDGKASLEFALAAIKSAREQIVVKL
ncbi:MAG TPA: Gfo/Idh/MocA family oxidoreductase [Actinobacteria bacterium]|nr:Gfo/Idh/MocA family oxidoreductase [Actinomycetota bacterium]